MLQPSASLLNEKVAIVTGGGGGIGKGISLAFAAYGAMVVVAERNPQRASETVSEIQKLGGQAIASVVDVQERDQVAEMAETVFREFGKVDILVNNVGDYLGIRKVFLDTTEEDWQALYRINLGHVFLCTKAIAPRMVERGAGGSIINVSTIEAFRGIPEMSLYSAFKGAITQFTKSFAIEVGQYGIRVNAIAPETTDTLQVPLDQRFPPERRHLIPLWIPLGRFGTPDDMAGAAIYLASDLSRWVTGTTIHVDGGALAAGAWFRTEEGGWTHRPRKP